MKKFLFIFTLLLIASACSESKPTEEVLPLDSYKREISYLVGADHAQQIVQDPNFAKYNMKEVMSGFELGLKNPAVFDAACQENIQKLIGSDQRQFNMEYKDPASLSIGKLLGSVFKTGWERAKSFNEFDLKYISYGFSKALTKADTLIKPEIKQKMLTEFMTKVNNKVMVDINKAEKAYFEVIKMKSGIQSLPQGLYLETLTAGKGGSPISSDDVKAHYVLMSAQGDTIQSSLNGPEVPIFNLSGVIPGWTVGIPFMKKGGKYKLYVPQAMAYGANPPDQSIPQFATLVFYVELIDFGKAGSLK